MIIITTPTGAIGHQVLEHVLRREEPIRVIARDPAALPSHVPERTAGVQAPHSDAAVVNKAFAGAEAVFWLVPPDPRATTVDAAYLDFTRPACAALKTQGAERGSRHGLAQDGRPHREHGRVLPGGDQPVVHGQPAPAG